MTSDTLISKQHMLGIFRSFMAGYTLITCSSRQLVMRKAGAFPRLRCMTTLTTRTRDPFGMHTSIWRYMTRLTFLVLSLWKELMAELATCITIHCSCVFNVTDRTRFLRDLGMKFKTRRRFVTHFERWMASQITATRGSAKGGMTLSTTHFSVMHPFSW